MLPGSHSTSSLPIVSRELWQKTGRERNVATGGFYKLVRSSYVCVAEPSPASPRRQPGPPRSLRVQACYRHAGAAWPGTAAAPRGIKRRCWEKRHIGGGAGGAAGSTKACQRQSRPSCDYKLRMTGGCPLARVTQMRQRREGRTFLTYEAANNAAMGTWVDEQTLCPRWSHRSRTLLFTVGNGSTYGILAVKPIGDA